MAIEITKSYFVTFGAASSPAVATFEEARAIQADCQGGDIEFLWEGVVDGVLVEIFTSEADANEWLAELTAASRDYDGETLRAMEEWTRMQLDGRGV